MCTAMLAHCCAQPLLIYLQSVTVAAKQHTKAAACCAAFLQDRGAWPVRAPPSTLRQSCRCWRPARGRAQDILLRTFELHTVDEVTQLHVARRSRAGGLLACPACMAT